MHAQKVLIISGKIPHFHCLRQLIIKNSWMFHFSLPIYLYLTPGNEINYWSQCIEINILGNCPHFWHERIILCHPFQIECRILHVLTKFAVVSIFFWMMLEGFYLHWLMVNTFNQPKLPLFIFAGWGEQTNKVSTPHVDKPLTRSVWFVYHKICVGFLVFCNTLIDSNLHHWNIKLSEVIIWWEPQCVTGNFCHYWI